MRDVVTGNEINIYFRRIEHSPSWVAESEVPSTLVHCTLFEPKSMFYISLMTANQYFLIRYLEDIQQMAIITEQIPWCRWAKR